MVSAKSSFSQSGELALKALEIRSSISLTVYSFDFSSSPVGLSSFSSGVPSPSSSSSSEFGTPSSSVSCSPSGVPSPSASSLAASLPSVSLPSLNSSIVVWINSPIG